MYDKLATYVEQISDDFESTFQVIDDDTLANMLGFENDFKDLARIIRNYIPEAKVQFIKTGNFKDKYDLYLIRLKP